MKFMAGEQVRKKPGALDEPDRARSPGAAASDGRVAMECSQALLAAGISAPEDGRTPGIGGAESMNPDIQFTLATEADDADIRRLLRENPMAGRISLSLEREPDFFTEARCPGSEHQTIVARDESRVVCAGTCSFRQRFVNGEPRRVGYLGGLRLDASMAGRFDILRRGYRFFHQLQRASPADFYFTAIAADNQRARKFLERGLPGMPRYESLGDFVTMLVPVPRGCRVAAGVPPAATVEELLAVLDEHNRGCQFAPGWTAEQLQALHPLGLRMENFRVLPAGGKAVACAALWDQRAFKQAVIRAYAPPLALARTWINFAARLRRRPGFPAAGSTLAHAAVSHLAAPADQPELVAGLIHSLFPIARSKGIEWLTLGFAAADPRLAALGGRFAVREYRSRLYRVRWPDLPGGILEDRLPCPEIALL
jgi:hypothetical protein